jgi:hypothetical protein
VVGREAVSGICDTLPGMDMGCSFSETARSMPVQLQLVLEAQADSVTKSTSNSKDLDFAKMYDTFKETFKEIEDDPGKRESYQKFLNDNYTNSSELAKKRKTMRRPFHFPAAATTGLQQ